MPKLIDLTGETFGGLKVIEKDQQLTKEKSKTYWKCQCSCGRRKSIRGDALKSGKAKTCGQCKIDLTGQKFGRLIVQSRGKTDKIGHIYWFCKCECGNITEVNSDNLRRGYTKSCECLQQERAHKIHFKDLTGQRFGKLVALKYNYNKDTKKLIGYVNVIAENKSGFLKLIYQVILCNRVDV